MIGKCSKKGKSIRIITDYRGITIKELIYFHYIFNSTLVLDMSDNEDFDQGDAGSADTIPIQAGSVKKNSYCMLKGHPCKVTEYSTAKPGKHGAAKATIVGTDIFTGKKH